MECVGPHLAAEEPWAQKCGGQAGRNDSFSQHVLHFPAEADVDGETTERHTTRPESRPSAHASQSLAEEKHYCHVALIRDTQHLNILTPLPPISGQELWFLLNPIRSPRASKPQQSSL